MRLEILLPFRVLIEVTDVSRIVAETHDGSFGLLPHRRDCVAALVPGILTYQSETGGEVFVAVDEGVLTKVGDEVRVAVSAASLSFTVSEPTTDKLLAEQIRLKAARKLRARRDGSPGVWSGVGMMGLIGWSVVLPTLLGAALGIWLDSHYPGTHPWTLALLMAGLVLGCLNAWRWVEQQDRAMHDSDDSVDSEEKG